MTFDGLKELAKIISEMLFNILLGNDALVTDMVVLLLGQEPGVLIGCNPGALDTPEGTGNSPFLIFDKLLSLPYILYDILLCYLNTKQLLEC